MQTIRESERRIPLADVPYVLQENSDPSQAVLMLAGQQGERRKIKAEPDLKFHGMGLICIRLVGQIIDKKGSDPGNRNHFISDRLGRYGIK